MERIDDPSIRLLTLAGPGGTGKSRLGLQAAAERIDRFPDGVFFVDLAPASDVEAFTSRVAAAVGIRVTGGQSQIDELKSKLRERRVLLLLDNFEQVVSAGPTVVDLLGACPSLKALVTSREALRVRGEHRYPVPPLSMPHGARGDWTARRLGRFEAILLFVERARTVDPGFRLTDDNAAAVLAICRRLDGLPLAIELATARINLFPPEALLARLGSGRSPLGVARDLPARQQTLHATIQWSYDLLDPTEQRLLELLSVFAGAQPEAIEEAAAMVGEPFIRETEVLDVLASLVDKSLVVVTGREGARQRVTMLETIRSFALERLDATPVFASAARRAHADYYTRWAERWSATPQAGHGGGRRAADDEIPNLSAAWRWWLAERRLDRLEPLADVLWPAYDSIGAYRAIVDLATQLLDVLSTAPPSAARSAREYQVRLGLARTLSWFGGYSGQAIQAYDEVVAALERESDPALVIAAARSIVAFYQFQGENDAAIALAERAVALADQQDDPGLRINAHMMLGSSQALGGSLARALEECDRGIEMYVSGAYQPRGFGLGADVAVICHVTSALVLWTLGRPDTAASRSLRGIEVATRLDHPFSLAYALFHSGLLHLWLSEPAVVRDRATRILRVTGEHEMPVWDALGRFMLGAASVMLGDPNAGLAQIDDGLGRFDGLRTPPVFGPFVRLVHAGALAAAGRLTDAMAQVEAALVVAESQPERPAFPAFYLLKADLLLATDPSGGSAEPLLRKAHAIAAGAGARMLELQAATRLCELERRRRGAAACVELRSVLGTFTEGFETVDLRRAAAGLGDVMPA